MTERQTIILAVAIVAGGFLLGGRYGYDVAVAGADAAVSESSSAGGYVAAYKINRLTGSIERCVIRDCNPLLPRKPEAAVLGPDGQPL